MTDQLVFAHVPKTGGVWVVDVLRAHGTTVEVGPSHTPLSWLPEQVLAERTVFGVLRDPVSWYGSWYRHAMANGQTGFEALAAFGRGSTSFREVIRGATSPWTLRDLPVHFGGMLRFQPGQDHRPSLAAHRGGLWSWFYDHLLGDPPLVNVLLDHAHLHRDMGQLLGVELDADRFPPKHTGAEHARGGAVIEWDQTMRGWVEEADGDRYLGFRSALTG